MILRFLAPTHLLAATEGTLAEVSATALFFQHVAAAVIFSFIGLLAFGAAIWAVKQIIPFSLRKELEEDHNVALAIIIAALIVGMAIIIASAIQG